jgi:predicted O-methyltransferase YrrM
VGFDATLRAIEHVEGWLTDAQALRLWSAASRLSAPARIVEIGSFQGRSTVILATAAASGIEVVAIDPHAGNDRGPQEISGYEAEAASDNERFEQNLRDAGVRDRVRHVRAFSDAAHGEVEDPIDLLYIDGAHRYAPARDDIVQWGRRVRPGGTMLIHDSFSSIGVTGAIVTALVPSSDWTYVGRSGSLTEYRREAPPSRATNVARQAASLPWFAKNVVLKALIASKILKRDWPY